MNPRNISTSYYARSGTLKDAYAISVYGPDWYEGKSLSLLAPPRKTVMDYKKGRITEKEYVVQYLAHITRNGETAQDLYDAIPENAILLCYETVGEFCHRRVFTTWLENETGIIIPEILSEEEIEQNQYNQLVDTLLDFE